MAGKDNFKADDTNTSRRDRALGKVTIQKYTNEELTRAASIRVEAIIARLPGWQQRRARENMQTILSDIVHRVQGFNAMNPGAELSPDVIARGSDSINAMTSQEVSEAMPTTAQKIENQKRWLAALEASGVDRKTLKALKAIFGESVARYSNSSEARADSGSASDAGYSGAKEGYAGYTASAGEKFGSYSYKPPKESWKEHDWQDWNDSSTKSGSSSARNSGIDGHTGAPALKEPGQKLNLERVKTFKDIKTAPVVPGNTSPADMTPEEKEAFLDKVYGEDKKPESADRAKTPVSKVNGGEGDAVAASANAEAAKVAPSAPSGQHNYSALNQRSKAGASHREALKNKDPSSAPVAAVTPDAAPVTSAEPAKPSANAMLHQRARHSTRPALTS